MAKDKATTGNTPMDWSKADKRKVREILSVLCSAKTSFNEDDLDPFLWGAGQINADLALAAYGELQGI
jgi:hypothetical protein